MKRSASCDTGGVGTSAASARAVSCALLATTTDAGVLKPRPLSASCSMSSMEKPNQKLRAIGDREETGAEHFTQLP